MPDLLLLTRRDVLRLGTAAAAGASLAACTTASNTGQPQSTPPTPGAPDDPDAQLRVTVSGGEQVLSGLYQYVATLLPANAAAKVTALGVRHDAYQKAISPHATASIPSPEPQSGKDPAALIKRLRTAETQAAAERAQQSLTAQDTELARLIVLAGAGAASAAEVLRTVTT